MTTTERISRTELNDLIATNPGLEEGQSIRFNHSTPYCSGGRDSAILRRTERGYSVYCYRCSRGGSVHSTAHYRATGKVGGSGYSHASIPISTGPASTATTEWRSFPAAPRDWLRKGHIFGTVSEDWGIQWDDVGKKLWLPVKQEGHFAGWVMRKFDPKDVRNYFDDKDNQFGVIVNPDSETLIIVEDWVSAIRVSKFHSVVALLGTWMRPKALAWIAANASKFSEVVVFMDGDNTSVRMKARKIAQQVSFLGTVRQVETGHDPKHLTDTELEELL